jgi:hypothetical protein
MICNELIKIYERHIHKSLIGGDFSYSKLIIDHIDDAVDRKMQLYYQYKEYLDFGDFRFNAKRDVIDDNYYVWGKNAKNDIINIIHKSFDKYKHIEDDL